jgi:hypothetical protein
MSSDEQNRAFEHKVKDMLDDSVEHLDAQTLSRLKQARHRALDSASIHRRPAWLIPTGGFAVAASVAVLTAILWHGKPVDHDMMQGFEDLELLSSSESLEFYEDLDFYSWLEYEENERS